MSAFASTVTYTAPSGARVLNAGTFAFGCYLVARCPLSWTVPAPSAQSEQVVGQMMANITGWVTHGQTTLACPVARTMRASVPKSTIIVAQRD